MNEEIKIKLVELDNIVCGDHSYVAVAEEEQEESTQIINNQGKI